jgi:hypothetical protein
VDPKLFSSKHGEIVAEAESSGEFQAYKQHQGADMHKDGLPAEHKYGTAETAGSRVNLKLASPTRNSSESTAAYKERALQKWREKGALVFDIRNSKGVTVKQYRFSQDFIVKYISHYNPNQEFNLGARSCPTCWKKGTITVHRLDHLKKVDDDIVSGRKPNWGHAEAVPADCGGGSDKSDAND